MPSGDRTAEGRLNVLEAFMERYEPMLRQLATANDRRRWAEEQARDRWLRWKFRLGVIALVVTMACTILSSIYQVLGR